VATALHLDPAEEAQLLDRAKQGDAAALTSLLDRYDSKILRLARNITQNQEDAEDVVQDTFLKAFTHLDRFEGGSRFYTWLVRIAVNESLMKLRKRRTGKEVSLDEPVESGDESSLVREIAVWDDTPEVRYSQTEVRGILDAAVDALEPIYRTVFVLRDVEELSTEETADALDLSIPAVKSRLLRARLQLREKLTKSFRRAGDNTLAYL
jgi:RNA polymerase sigma-70 factor, ECF subfamily